MDQLVLTSRFFTELFIYKTMIDTQALRGPTLTALGVSGRTEHFG